MEEFPYYSLSWFFYLIAAAIFLLLSAWKSRGWSIWLRIPLLTFIAALALTPGITISGGNWWSPAAIIMIFELDKHGLVGVLRSALSIIAVWIFLISGTFFLRWKLKKKYPSLQQSKVANKNNEQVDLIDPFD